jgi:DNA-directed RNA polymerase subunit RPC12/RpoP
MSDTDPVPDGPAADAADAPPTGPAAAVARQFPCGQCGAELKFEPGTAALTCPYCSHQTVIPQSEEQIEELDYHAALADLATRTDTSEQARVHCDGCGAEVDAPATTTALSCPYCDSPIVRAPVTARTMRPKSLLPFKVERPAARDAFRAWVRGLWFAPNALKRYAELNDRITGMYVPYWTFDTLAVTFYRGERGDDYWVTQTYTTTENGRRVTRTRQVRKTRWRSVSGTVWNDFDDVLVLATRSLPTACADRLDPWDLQNLAPYADEYLSGFRAESHQVSLDEGFEVAKEKMQPAIDATIRRDIGGDHQRIHSRRSRYDRLTFKHILLPVWVSAYRFRNRVFRFLVNGRTGEVQGERPYSVAKILAAVVAAIALVVAIVLLVAR